MSIGSFQTRFAGATIISLLGVGIDAGRALARARRRIAGKQKTARAGCGLCHSEGKEALAICFATLPCATVTFWFSASLKPSIIATWIKFSAATA